MKVIRLSLLRSGGVMERPGEADGVATGVGLRLLRRMDCGVNAVNTGPEAARARARWKQRNRGTDPSETLGTSSQPCLVKMDSLTLTTWGVWSRLSSGALLMLFGDAQETGNLGGLSRGRGV